MASEPLDVFTLKGKKFEFEGHGVMLKRTEEFYLSKGILIWECKHAGNGMFEVALSNDLGVSHHLLAKGSGEGIWTGAYRVSADKSESLVIKSTGLWSCRLIQPALGQALVDFSRRSVGNGENAASYCIAGNGGNPADYFLFFLFRVGSRPVLANGKHDGIGKFTVYLLSLDGTDERVSISETGQCCFEERETGAKPGKEYLILVAADGAWEIKFTEGY